MSIKSLNDIDFQSKSGIKNALEKIDYSLSAEPTLKTLKEGTLKEHLSYLAKSVNWIKEKLDSNSIIETPPIITIDKSNISKGQWYNANCYNYRVDENITNTIFNDGDMTNLISFNPYINCSITFAPMTTKSYTKSIIPTINSLINAKFNVYAENDLEEMLSNSEMVVLTFTFDTNQNVIVECYKQFK